MDLLLSFMAIPRDEYEGALKVLTKYYRELMDEIVTDIIRNKDEFEQGGFGRAEELIDRHYTRLAHLGCLHANIRQWCAQKPKGTEPLSKDQFRCFGCGGVIAKEDDACRLCGWTWR